MAGPFVSDDEGSFGDGGGREDATYLAASTSDEEDDTGVKGTTCMGTRRGGRSHDRVDESGIGSLESKYLSASLLAKIESGQDVVINGRRL